ncbi:C-type lectin-like [Ruditapes philippinarum]|uniref:C-type lectin-like n=1 Tax=Ruditapes philippinarum TaxID=129788 RepID=UPI00295B2236|nr:C-type lectin-like [Ruditapes philippinarum]
MKLKLPKLRMIGKAIENIEVKIESGIEKLENETAQKICDLNPCLPWSDWSKCSSNIHIFGSKFRTRQCSLDLSTCKVDTTNSKIEKQFEICGGFCPLSYNITKNGFCLKLFSDKGRNKEAAELKCQEDNGHLINIDSEIKYEDVGSLMEGFGTSVWIDGYRKDVSSHWTYTYGYQKGFFKWYTGQPSNSSSELCLSVHKYSAIQWRDSSCNNQYYSICEVISSLT